MSNTEIKKETMKWFEEQINHVKSMCTYMDTEFHNVSEDRTITAKSVLIFASDMYNHLTDIYEILRQIVTRLYEIEQETDKQTLRFGRQLKKLRKILEKHEPTMERLKEAFEWTEKVLDEDR